MVRARPDVLTAVSFLTSCRLLLPEWHERNVQMPDILDIQLGHLVREIRKRTAAKTHDFLYTRILQDELCLRVV